jgi:hypothetical protein
VKKVLIVGAGLFGCCSAIELSRAGFDVTLIDKKSDIMTGASKHNHNRIHFGFHYPRSIETARQSLDGLALFLMRFRDSIVSEFPNYYFIEKTSKVTPSEYLDFCDKINIDYEIKYPKKDLLNTEKIDLSLKVLEPVYDYRAVEQSLKKSLNDLKVKQKYNCTITDIETKKYNFVVNSSYSGINQINKHFEASLIKLKQQDVIIPIFEANQDKVGLTIMDGPFCSIMPKGFEKNKFLLYHVLWSVGSEAIDETLNVDYAVNERIDMIYKESTKYYPFLKNVKRVGFWRTPRVLPINDNDERLSELFYNKQNPNYVSVLSGKVSTCWTTALKIKKLVQEATL